MLNIMIMITLLLSSFGLMSCQKNKASPHVIVSEYADVIRAQNWEPQPGILDDPALTQVTRDFGQTQIDLRKLPIRPNKVNASPRPWSSWWFPKKENILFTNDPAGALRKYDLYRIFRAERNNTQFPASAAELEAGIFNRHALSWEGLCDAWALASISYPEPRRSITFDFDRYSGNDDKKVTFTVGDLKALLLMSYESTEDEQLNYYGQKFTGDENGWIYPDLFPDQFHRFIEVQLFEKKQPFVLDHDPGIEVWNVPVYAANYVIEAIPGKPNEVSVRLWIYHAGPTEAKDPQHLDFVGTKEIVREYNYNLVGVQNSAGILTVNAGYWTIGPTGANSRNDHPDFVISLPAGDTIKRKARNQEIDIDTVDEILKRAL